MGIITAILSVLGSVFGVIASMASWAVKTIPWYVWVVLIVGCVIFGYGYKAGSGGKGMNCSCRDFMCRRTPREPRLVTVGPFKVVSIDTGASITVAAGLRDRRHETIRLQFIEAPAEGGPATVSTEHLRGLAGDSITVQYERHGIFRDDAHNSLRRQDEEIEAADETPEILDARVPLVGIVFGFSGINLNLAQVSGGYAACSADAPDNFKAAERAAKKKPKQ